MRRKLPSLVLAVLVALATAGVAAAGNGGFAPGRAGLAERDAHPATRTTLILGFTAAIFVLVESLLVVFVIKYRSRGRPRAVEGAQVHGHTRLELIWTAFPVVILAIIAGFVFYELPNIDSAPAAANPIHITVEGHQYYWQFDYPNGARSIGTLHVPAGAVVDLKVVSPDVIHSWWIPALGGKIQAIPGRINHTWFQATKPGTLRRASAPSSAASSTPRCSRPSQAESQQAYRHYLATWHETIGKQIWSGVCATCHGNLGQGGYGPAIANNTLLTQPVGADRDPPQRRHRHARARCRRSATRGRTDEINALAAYVKKHIYKAAPLGATSGG